VVQGDEAIVTEPGRLARRARVAEIELGDARRAWP